MGAVAGLAAGPVAGQAVMVTEEVPSGPVNGSNARFYLINVPNPLSSVAVYVNGLRQRKCLACDLTAFVSGGRGTLLFNACCVPKAGSVIVADYQYASLTDCTAGGTVAGFVEVIGPVGTIKCGTILPPGVGILAALSPVGLQFSVDTTVIPTFAALPPHIIVYTVTDASVTSYTIPAGLAGVCIVTRNIAQSMGVDYALTPPVGTTPGQIMFVGPLAVGDVIQLDCW